MEVGISTACFYPMLTEEALEEAAKTGAKRVELFLNAEGEYELSYCEKLQAILKRNGMEVVSAHAFCIVLEPYLFNEYERRRQDAQKTLCKFLKAAQFLGARYYTFHGNLSRATTEEFDYPAYAARLDELADLCGEYGLFLAWENVCWCQSGDPAFMQKALQYSKSPYLKCTFDFKQAFRAGHSPEDFLAVMGERLVNIHINDWNGNCCLPGQGTLDYPSLLSHCPSYKGDVILEVYAQNFQKTEELQQSMQYIKNILG